MRNLFIIGMLLVAAFMAGWFKIQRDGERTTIEINRTEIRNDTRTAIDRGREFLDRRDQEYADQQFADQQQQVWPQEQVAAQQDAWGTTYDSRQPAYYDPNYSPQNQQVPNQSFDPRQANPYAPQPYYPPVTR